MLLAIIMTGQLRTFFNNDYFTVMIQEAKKHYNEIFIIGVLNSHNHNIVSNYFSGLYLKHLLMDYPHYLGEYHNDIHNKYTNHVYSEIKDKYFASDTSAKREINDPDTWAKDHAYIQSHQLKVGLRQLREYEEANHIQFDIICKTRFDLRYPHDFYPHVPNHINIFDKITFNKTNRALFDKKCAELDITNIDELIEFNKNKTFSETECRVDWNTIHLTFGSMYCYNHYALENIKNGHENVLYALNDMCLFGKRETMLKMESWFDESGLIDPSQYNINHFYAPETQLMVYCFKYQINILCYYNDSFEIIR